MPHHWFQIARAEQEGRERTAQELEAAHAGMTRLRQELERKERQLTKAQLDLHNLGRQRFSPEDVAYWFFRLNGCLTTRDFILHPERRGSQRTDADLLAVRFPYRQEQSLVDDDFFRSQQKPTLMLVEVKAGKCQFNGPWTDPKAGNLYDVVRAIGFLTPRDLRRATDEVYARGRHTSALAEIVLIAIGNQPNHKLAKELPGSLQFTWEQTLEFLWGRFVTYHKQKAHHPQWDLAGNELFDLAGSARRDQREFVTAVCAKFSIHPAPTDLNQQT
jgi:hypothetical protein